MEEKYYFNEELFLKLHLVLECSVRELGRRIGWSDNTWHKWRRNKDLPLTVLMDVCNKLYIPAGHFILASDEKPTILMGERHYVQQADFKKVKFLNHEFGDEVTIVQGRVVIDFCKLVGISPNTFYRNFRNSDTISINLGVKSFLGMCNKTCTYPMDFLLSSGVEVPVLNGFKRKGNTSSETLKKRAIDILSQNARLARELDAEKEKVKELEEEVKRLKDALFQKHKEHVALMDEFEGAAMRVAENDV